MIAKSFKIKLGDCNIFQILRKKYKWMVMTIWDAVDKYYALNVDWPYKTGSPRGLIEMVKQVVRYFNHNHKTEKLRFKNIF